MKNLTSAIIVLFGIYHYFERENLIVDGTEVDHAYLKDPNLERLHQDKKGGHVIAFWQGCDDKKRRNRALVEFETAKHGSYAKGILWIKVRIFQKNIFS